MSFGLLAGLHWDLAIASASAGLLVYSGRVLVPAARLRPEDIIVLPGVPSSVGPDPFGVGLAPWSIFPEDDITLRIRDVLDSKVGFDLLVFGTIGGVFAVIVGAFTLSWNTPSTLNLAAVVVFGLLGYGAGWWWRERSGWYRRQARSLLVRCFFAWLELEVGDPGAKLQDFGLTVISTARTSGFSMMRGLAATQGVPRTDAEDEAAARWIVALARQYGYLWRRDDFRSWASEVATKN